MKRIRYIFSVLVAMSIASVVAFSIDADLNESREFQSKYALQEELNTPDLFYTCSSIALEFEDLVRSCSFTTQIVKFQKDFSFEIIERIKTRIVKVFYRSLSISDLRQRKFAHIYLLFKKLLI